VQTIGILLEDYAVKECLKRYYKVLIALFAMAVKATIIGHYNQVSAMVS
jgi:hypothetical protein